MRSETPCLEGKKHFSPYRCTFVPASDVIQLIKEYPKLSKIVFFDDFIKWYTEGSVCRAVPTGSLKGFHRKLDNKYWKSNQSLKLQEIFQRRLHYEKSTYTNGHIYHRFGTVYRKFINMSWHVDWISRETTITWSWDQKKLDYLLNITPNVNN